MGLVRRCSAAAGAATFTFALIGIGVTCAEDVAEYRAPETLIVRFEDEARVRLRGGRLVSFAGADLREIERALARHSGFSIRPLFGRSEEAVEASRRKAESRSGRLLPDLNSYVEIVLDDTASSELLERLKRIESVKTVYRASLPVPPPVDFPPPTPDGESSQIYLDPAPEGIDARDAWTRPGGRGDGVFLVDIEYDWRDTHEDLEAALGRQECYTPNSPGQIEHGTAVIGQIVGGDNGYGVTGIASQVELGLVTHLPDGMSYSVARAIDCATGLMGPGDVMLVEAQTVGPHGYFVPPEWDQAEYDAIAVATAAGIVVVETAGNGNENLDHEDFGGAFDRTVRDSGAIIVGAGADLWYETQPDRSRLDFSTYGSRVDLQGWGDDVVTTGYGDAFDGDGDPNQYYTALFNGTSSAAPMIAGAAAILQGVQMACGGEPLEPATVRDLLVATGSPQIDGPYPGNIGPRPDLRAALIHVDVDDDTDGWAECQGDCEDAVAATHPGAPETNDGLDNQCPGDSGHGIIDETSNDSGFHDPIDKTEYSWTPQADATRYEVSRSTTPDFSSECMRWETATTAVSDAETPPSGGVFYYLNHPLLPFPGSWGRSSSGVERTGTCL
jgi:hypothetical protein